MTSRKDISTAIKHLIRALCLIGGIVQSLIVLERYLDYPINIDTKLIRDEYIKLPAISVCVGYDVMFDKLESLYPAIYKVHRNRKSAENWDEILTVKQQEEVSVSRSDLFVSCYVAHQSNKTKCTNWASPVNLNYEYKCFENLDSGQQLKHGISAPYRLAEISNTRWAKIRFRIREKFRTGNYFAIGLHPRYMKTSPDMGSKSFHEFELIGSQRIAFTYTKTIGIFLPAPYASRCVHYTRDGAPIKRRRLVSACASERFFNASKHWPRDIFYVHREKFAEAKFAFNNAKKHSYIERDSCIKLYPWPDCVSESLITEVKSVINDGDNSTVLVLYPPTEPYLLMEQKPGFEMLDLLSYGSGILGLWLGFSLAGMGDFLVGRLAQELGNGSAKSKTRPAPVRPLILVYGNAKIRFVR
ncbi:hypothetical protein HDE_03925 [Halotydeus destructor]|nr:hypothetical protein HDE_03925 [Halotydeus destructor]